LSAAASPLANTDTSVPAAITPVGILIRPDPATVRMARMGVSDAHVVFTDRKPAVFAASFTTRDVVLSVAFVSTSWAGVSEATATGSPGL
jgi:hypothetical protein